MRGVAVPLQWSYEARGGVGVVRLAGYLGVRSVDRFAGALGWAAARHTAAVVLDVGGLLGWSADGKAAVADGAERLAAHGCVLHLCALHDLPRWQFTGSPVPVHADLAAALAALGGADPDS